MHLTKALYYARRFEECISAGEAGLDVCADPYTAFYSAFALIAIGKPGTRSVLPTASGGQELHSCWSQQCGPL